MILEAAPLALALLIALALRPWRMLGGGQLVGPACAVLVLLPWVWALPELSTLPLLSVPLRWSGACLVLLMLGWPLAVPVLLLVALAAGVIGAMPPAQMLSLALWQGLVPATLALGAGAAVRRWLPRNLFVYVFCRGFFATLACTFAAMLLARALHPGADAVDEGLSRLALWLMAWGDAMVTGMAVAVFVAFRPHWLATWSDRHYLPPR